MVGSSGQSRRLIANQALSQLSPQEDKLAVDGGVESVEEVARQVGWRLGRAHRRGAREAPSRPWSDRDLSGILDEAVELAGLFESIHLADCRDAARSLEDSTGQAER